MRLQVNDLRFHGLVESVLAISAADPGFAPAGMSTVHGLEVLPVEEGLVESQVAHVLQRSIQVLSEYG